MTSIVVLKPAQADPNIGDNQNEVERIKAELAEINHAAEQAVERYNQANVELEQTKQQIEANAIALQDATARLAGSQQVLERRVDRIYRQGSAGFIEVLLNTSSIHEFMSQYDMLGRISQQDRDIVEQVFNHKTEVENSRSELEQARQKQEELLATAAAEKNEIETRMAAKQEVLAGAEAEVARVIAAEEEEQRESQAEYTSQVASQMNGMPAPEAPSGGEYPAAAPPPPSSGGAVSIAMQYLGVPYVWGGESPGGFDCSGLVKYVYGQMGIYLPHSAAAQYYAGTPISYSQLAPGDLVFFGQPISHVGIYIGGGSMIHAPFEGAVVSITGVGGGGGYSGACRI